MAEQALSPDARMGAVHLSVASLARSIDYYEHAIGLQVHRRGDDDAALGAGGEDLLVLTEKAGARPARGFAGLFHFALLLPERTDLARWLLHAVREQTALSGLSDHFVSEALYLRDPDDHGIEIYWDRPRELWEGRVMETMTTLPLDADDLVATLDDPAPTSFDGMPGGTTMGHVHLCVASVPETVAFYRDEVGFDVMAMYGGQAAFLSVGGYHHHLGGNTWESAGKPAAPEDRARLEAFTIIAPGAEPRELRDPSGNRVRIVPA